MAPLLRPPTSAHCQDSTPKKRKAKLFLSLQLLGVGGACDTITPTLDYVPLGGDTEEEEGLAQSKDFLHACPHGTCIWDLSGPWCITSERLGAFSFNSVNSGSQL